MGRMHTPGKGISKSSLPYKRAPPSWLKVTPTQVEDHVCKLAKKGLTPSQVSFLFLIQILFELFKSFVLVLFNPFMIYVMYFHTDWCNFKRFQWYCTSKKCYWQ
jgi:hypothetical protein